MINAKQQGRLDGFFKVLPKDPSSKKAPEPAAKGKRKGTAGGKDDKKDTKKAKTTVKKK
jgi:flap endonuclease-1